MGEGLRGSYEVLFVVEVLVVRLLHIDMRLVRSLLLRRLVF